MAALTEFFRTCGGRKLVEAQEILFLDTKGKVAAHLRGTTDNWNYFVHASDEAHSRMEPLYAGLSDDRVNDLIYMQFRGRNESLKNALNRFATAEADEMRDLFNKDQYLVLRHVMA